MIIDTTLNGRPCTAMYMTRAFEPVDNEDDAELVKVRFMDEQGGVLFLVPQRESETSELVAEEKKLTTELMLDENQAQALKNRWEEQATLKQKWTADTFEEAKVSRDESGKFGGGGGGATAAEKPKGVIASYETGASANSTYPHTISVEHHPETGSKKPYEIWNHYHSGRKRRTRSFKTEESANEAAREDVRVVQRALAKEREPQKLTSADRIRMQRWEVTRARAMQLLQRFDPDQPRDEQGRWSSTGGLGGGADIGSIAAPLPLSQQPGAAEKLRQSASSLTGRAILQTPKVKPNSVLVHNVAKQLNKRAGDILQEAFGVRQITEETTNEQMDDFLANAIADDLKFGLESGLGSPTWYSDTMKEAMATATQLHPELATDSDKRFMFTAALAITSQGEVVDASARLTEQAYAYYAEHGELPERKQDIDTQDKNIRNNFKKLNELVKQMGSVDKVREFFDREMTKGEMDEIMGYDIPTTNVDAIVNGSAILGPKIGQGFYQNLNGNFDPITMDMWFMRSWGRITNTGIGQPDMGPIRERFVNALKAEGREVPSTEFQLDNAAEQALKEHERRYSKDPAYKAAKKPEIALAAERYVLSYDGKMVEQPLGGGQRKWIERVFGNALSKLASEGIQMDSASAQAVWWNPEKALYKHLGGRVRELDTDYAKAFQRIAQARGIKMMVTKADQRNPRLGYAPWIEDPDPPVDMTDDEIKQMAERAAKWMREHSKASEDKND